jgi:type IV secretory pathway VirJ component
MSKTRLTAALCAGLCIACLGVAAEPPSGNPSVVQAAASTKIAKKATAAVLPKNAEMLSHGRFKDITVYRPEGTPKSFVLFLSGDGGWNLGVVDMAQALVEQGAMVVGINTPKLLANFEQDGGQCVYPDGDLENLSHWVQAYYHLPTYLSPILVGYSSGATLAYATLAQAPKDTFAGALSLGFCPDLNLHKPLCKGSGIESEKRSDGHGVNFLPAKNLGDPWIALQGGIDQVCSPQATQDFAAKVPGAEVVMLEKVGHGYSVPEHWMPQFKAAFAKLAAQNPATVLPPPPTELGNLPVVEVAAKPGSAESDLFAVLMSGDGGWAGLDQNVANALAAKGIPVIGLDSLRYYWTPRTPDGVAADVDKLIRYYLGHLHKKRALLIGYSQGADVLPFIVNRLPEATRAQLALGAVMGLSEHAAFEFHLTNWVQDGSAGLPTLPEVQKISGVPLLCIYGEEETDTVCPKLDPQKAHIVALKGGHHFGGDYDRLAQEILAAAH